MTRTGPLRLFLVRHGETAANTEMRYLGTRDDALTERGAGQARRLAAAFRELPIDAVCTSPLRRAADTAAEIGRATGLAVTTDARLLEGGFGAWEGLTRSEVAALGEAERRQLQQWESDPSCSPPGGESLLSIQERVVALADELAAREGGAWVVLVSHVGPIKALLAAALGAGLGSARRLFLDPATISVVDWTAPPLLRLFNAHEHLGWREARWMKNKSP